MRSGWPSSGAAAVLALTASARLPRAPRRHARKLDLCRMPRAEWHIVESGGAVSLAGQPDIFTQWQLVYMRDGTRKVEAMEAGPQGHDGLRYPLLRVLLRVELKPPVPAHPKPSNAESAEALQLIGTAPLRELSR